VSNDKLMLRLTGVVTILCGLAFFDVTSHTVLHRLALPLIMALGAWALIQNLAAVALVGAVLAIIHTDLQLDHWIDSIAYPVLAASGAAVLGVIALRRFRSRIERTHEARWADRETK
jgi:hypothetical protein